MTTRLTLTGNAALIAVVKDSERTSSIPGAENGGTNLPSAFAPLQPRSASERDVAAAASTALSSWRPSGETGKNALDDLRAFRDANASSSNATTPSVGAIAGGSADGVTPNFGLGDISKKISEGTDALGAKFTSFDIGKKFDKAVTGGKEFLFGKTPEKIATDSPAVAAWKKDQLKKEAEGKISAAQANAAIGQSTADDTKHFVTLTDFDGYILTFYVMPEIVENRQVQYEAVAPPQFPGAFQKYKGTDSVQWTVNATFICRTSDEATRNLEYLNRLRGWTMPFFGTKTQEDPRYKDMTGAPPPVLMFKGFRESIVGEVPVVITSLQWNWPKDVDWIPARALIDDYETSLAAGGADSGADATIPFPTVIQVAISLVESFSTEQFNQFNLGEYQVGHMKNAFSNERYNASKLTWTATPPVREEAQTAPPGTSPSAGNRLASAAGAQNKLSGAAKLGASLRAGFDSRLKSVTEAVQSTTSNIQQRVRTSFSPAGVKSAANDAIVLNERGDG